MKLTVNQYLVSTLKNLEVDTVFGIPSYVGMNILKELHQAKFEILLNSHEQNAAHACEGYYLATGKPAVLALAMGPGLTNALTGIANAYIESVPMIILAGRPTTKFIGRNEYHANSGIGRNINESMLIKSVSKFSAVIDSPINAVTQINNALRMAIAGRPGPIFLSIPPEIQQTEIEVNSIPTRQELIAITNSVVDPAIISRIEELFNQAKKPVIILGKEISKQSIEILRKLLTDNVPYFTTYGAKGKVPVLANYLGCVWYDGSGHITQACEEADLVLALGEEFSAFSVRQIATQLTGKVVQVHSDAQEVGRSMSLKMGFAVDTNLLLAKLNLSKKPWMPSKPKSVNSSTTWKYMDVINKLAPSDAVFFADVGNAGYLSITDLVLKESQDFYTTGKNGICGYSIPSAIGYSHANTTKPVISIVGDLSFVMNMQETVNVKKFKTKNSFIIFNNFVPQNIYADQIAELHVGIQSDMAEVSFAGAAAFAGIQYVKCQNPEEFEAFMQTADFVTHNYLIELVIDKNDQPLVE